MTYEDKRQHFQLCKKKGDVMAVVEHCRSVASYATVIKALNTPSIYKSKKEQQIIDVSYKFVKSREKQTLISN